MSKEKPLKALRHEIDTIDNAIHDLIMERTKIVEQVRKAKLGQNIKIRPARECSILYRLMRRHKGPFPRRELARMWRELIVATLSFEGPFSVGVHMPDLPTIAEPSNDRRSSHWNMAKDQYGSFTPMQGYPSAGRLVDAVRSQEVTLGVLPMPERGEQAPWWPLLASHAVDTPRIINRLPFIGSVTINNNSPIVEALVICPVASEPTGRDHTYLIIEATDEIGLERLTTALNEAELTPFFTSVWCDPASSSRYMHLAEVEGFIANDDIKILRLGANLDRTASSMRTIGTFGLPLTLDETETN